MAGFRHRSGLYPVPGKYCHGFILLAALELPIAVALAASSLIVVAAWGGLPLAYVPQQMFGALDSFTLLAIPFFIVAGMVMARSEMSRALLGLIAGGGKKGKARLPAVATLGSVFFGSISGSGPAGVAALGSFFVPAMVKRGYQAPFAAALVRRFRSVEALFLSLAEDVRDEVESPMA